MLHAAKTKHVAIENTLKHASVLHSPTDLFRIEDGRVEQAAACSHATSGARFSVAAGAGFVRFGLLPLLVRGAGTCIYRRLSALRRSSQTGKNDMDSIWDSIWDYIGIL